MVQQSDARDDAALAVWVQQTGLVTTFEKFPEDVAVAFKTVAKLRASTLSTAGDSTTFSCDPLTELWPPMRVKE
jgi:hypothetical protein